MKRLIVIFFFAATALSLMAEPTMNRRLRPHEIRLGYGDPFFETMAWHASPMLDYGEQTHNYRYTGHIFLEYQYRVNYWFSFGVQADYQQVFWDKWTYTPTEVQIESDRYFYDISVFPTMRFTYLHTYWVNLYSGLGAGILVNAGTEKDMRGRTVAVAPVVDISLIGLSVGHDMLFGTLEFGGMFSLLNMNEIYMVDSRIISASIGVRF